MKKLSRKFKKLHDLIGLPECREMVETWFIQAFPNLWIYYQNTRNAAKMQEMQNILLIYENILVLNDDVLGEIKNHPDYQYKMICHGLLVPPVAWSKQYLDALTNLLPDIKNEIFRDHFSVLAAIASEDDNRIKTIKTKGEKYLIQLIYPCNLEGLRVSPEIKSFYQIRIIDDIDNKYYPLVYGSASLFKKIVLYKTPTIERKLFLFLYFDYGEKIIYEMLPKKDYQIIQKEISRIIDPANDNGKRNLLLYLEYLEIEYYTTDKELEENIVLFDKLTKDQQLSVIKNERFLIIDNTNYLIRMLEFAMKNELLFDSILQSFYHKDILENIFKTGKTTLKKKILHRIISYFLKKNKPKNLGKCLDNLLKFYLIAPSDIGKQYFIKKLLSYGSKKMIFDIAYMLDMNSRWDLIKEILFSAKKEMLDTIYQLIDHSLNETGALFELKIYQDFTKSLGQENIIQHLTTTKAKLRFSSLLSEENASDQSALKLSTQDPVELLKSITDKKSACTILELLKVFTPEEKNAWLDKIYPEEIEIAYISKTADKRDEAFVLELLVINFPSSARAKLLSKIKISTNFIHYLFHYAVSKYLTDYLLAFSVKYSHEINYFTYDDSARLDFLMNRSWPFFKFMLTAKSDPGTNKFSDYLDTMNLLHVAWTRIINEEQCFEKVINRIENYCNTYHKSFSFHINEIFKNCLYPVNLLEAIVALKIESIKEHPVPYYKSIEKYIPEADKRRFLILFNSKEMLLKILWENMPIPNPNFFIEMMSLEELINEAPFIFEYIDKISQEHLDKLTDSLTIRPNLSRLIIESMRKGSIKSLASQLMLINMIGVNKAAEIDHHFFFNKFLPKMNKEYSEIEMLKLLFKIDNERLRMMLYSDNEIAFLINVVFQYKNKVYLLNQISDNNEKLEDLLDKHLFNKSIVLNSIQLQGLSLYYKRNGKPFLNSLKKIATEFYDANIISSFNLFSKHAQLCVDFFEHYQKLRNGGYPTIECLIQLTEEFFIKKSRTAFIGSDKCTTQFQIILEKVRKTLDPEIFFTAIREPDLSLKNQKLELAIMLFKEIELDSLYRKLEAKIKATEEQISSTPVLSKQIS